MTPAPTKCPVCGASLSEHTTETDKNYEAWNFMCDAVILRMENGKLSAETDCGDATNKAVNELNRASP